MIEYPSAGNFGKDRKLDISEHKKFIPFMTYIFAAINVAVFLAETVMGGSEDVTVAIKFGAMYVPYVLEKGEWYRLFTAMFIHFGFEHILMNMVALCSMGAIVEEYFGRVRYVILYLIAGFGGNILSMCFDILNGDTPVSAGASGAICGLLAVFVFLALDRETRSMYPLGRVFIGIVFALEPGFRTEGIDVMAHLGGFLSGLLVGGIMFLIKQIKKNKMNSLGDSDGIF